jgi:uncharacterized delta-60 repeat protein
MTRKRLLQLVLVPLLTGTGHTAVHAGTGDLDPAFADHGRQVELPGMEARFVEPMAAGGLLVGTSGVLVTSNGIDGCTIDGFSAVTQLDADGTSDPSFTPARIGGIQAISFARQADGRIVGVGRRVRGNPFFGGRCFLNVRSLAAFRLNLDGSLDTTFGAGGIFDWDAGGTGSLHQGRSVLLEENGAVVIAGATSRDRGRLIVLRLQSDGNLDPSFGDSGVYVGSRVGFQNAVGIARAPDGGYRAAGTGPDGCVVVGIRNDGTPDSSFGVDGVAEITTADGDRVTCTSLESKGNGRLLVAGQAHKYGFVAQFLTSGVVDRTFAADTSVAESLSVVTAIRPGTRGSVYVAGTGPKGTSILRLNATGALDGSFGDQGRTWIDLPLNNQPRPAVHAMALDAAGNLVAAGASPFVIRLFGESGGESAGVASVLPDVSVQEADGQAIVRVRRSGGGDGAISVSYRTVADGDAVAGEDFTAREGTLHWADGDRSRRAIVVNIAEDGGRAEHGEFFHVVLEDVQGVAGLGRSAAKVGIQPDGDPGGQIQFAPVYDSSIHRIAVEDDFVQVILGRDYYAAGRVCVTVGTRSGTAVAGADFTATELVQCWADGDTEHRLVNIPVLQDHLNEQDETFTVVLSHPTGGAIVGERRTARITIRGN